MSKAGGRQVNSYMSLVFVTLSGFFKIAIVYPGALFGLLLTSILLVNGGSVEKIISQHLTDMQTVFADTDTGMMQVVTCNDKYTTETDIPIPPISECQSPVHSVVPISDVTDKTATMLLLIYIVFVLSSGVYFGFDIYGRHNNNATIFVTHAKPLSLPDIGKGNDGLPE
ncbi:MAG: hypothetical protein V3W04_13805 [Gammaproteobacteria bacterium]